MTFKTMLAGKCEDTSKLRFPVLVSPKLDGVRCHVINGVAVSRNLLPFRNPQIQKMFGKFGYDGLDGELMVGDPTRPEAFRQTGLLNSHGGDCSEVKLFVFDDFTTAYNGFEDRLWRAHSRIDSPHLAPVAHYTAENEDDLLKYEAEFLRQGYEGLMIRDPRGPYKYGRSTPREGWLLKLKQFEDGEAVIDDAEELMHNANEKTLVRGGKAVRNSKKSGMVGKGTLGNVLVRDVHTGVAFSVGSGFDDCERAQLWGEHQAGKLVGRVIKYQYFPTGSKDKPRFPTFKGFRDPIDL